MPEPINLPDNPGQCPTCGTPFQGSFCYNCGEKRPSRKDYTVAKYATQAVDMFTHFDGKFFTSIKYLLFYPGRLTEENLLGRKVKLMKPIQLFLVISVVYFLFMKGFDLFVIYFRHLSDRDPLFIQGAKHAASQSVSLEEYAHHFDQVIWPVSKALIFILVPLLGLGAWALFSRRIKPFVPHLIFSTHVLTFFLAFILFYFEVILRWFDPSLLSKSEKLTGMLVGIAVMSVYLFFAIKRVYRQGIIASLLKSIAFMIWFVVVIAAYKLLMGWVTLMIV